MLRRGFIVGLGLTSVWPFAAHAQQPTKLIGFLGATTPSAQPQWTGAFVQRLRDLGWIEGHTITIEYKWGEGQSERYPEIVAEFVRSKVDVIVVPGGATLAAKKATSVIPIVFTAATDPVGSGLVSSLARPGGNVTGLSLQAPDLVGKRLEFIREISPSLHRLGIMTDVSYSAAVEEMRDLQETAGKLGIETDTLAIKRAQDIAPAFASVQGRIDALYVVADPLVSVNRARINSLAYDARLPTMQGFRELAEGQGLMSYGPSFPELYTRAAEFVDKILRGVKPAEIPVEQPTKFEFVINLKTANALGITIPQTLLATADEVIE